MISEPDIITTEPEEQCLHTSDTEDRNKIVYNFPLGKYVWETTLNLGAIHKYFYRKNRVK